MATQLELGQDVFARDGEKVGTVDRLVVNPRTRAIEQIIVHSGFFTQEDKLIESGLIDRVDAGGIRLDASGDEVHGFPTFVEEHYAAASHEDSGGGGLLIPNVGGTGELMYEAPATGRGYPGTGSIFDPAPTNPPPLETASNVPENDAIISDGTDVIGADGDKLGTVSDVTIDTRGHLESFVVKAGLLFKHDVRITADQIAEFGSDHVRLSITADQADSQG